MQVKSRFLLKLGFRVVGHGQLVAHLWTTCGPKERTGGAKTQVMSHCTNVWHYNTMQAESRARCCNIDVNKFNKKLYWSKSCL